MQKYKKIAFVGASGFGNMGDDCYRNIFSEYLEKENIVSVFDSPYPDLRVLEDADLLVIGGGGLIYNDGSPHYSYVKKYTDEAIRLNIPYKFISVGVQPNLESIYLNEKLGSESMLNRSVEQIKCWKNVLSHAKGITVRAEMDVRILEKLGIKSQYFSDLGYLIKPAKAQITVPNSTVLIIGPSALRHSKHRVDYYIEQAKKKKVPTYVLVMSADDLTASVDTSLRIEQNYRVALQDLVTPELCASVLKNASEVLSCRYHGTVFARAMGVPKIEVIDKRYKAKSDNFIDIDMAIESAKKHFEILLK